MPPPQSPPLELDPTERRRLEELYGDLLGPAVYKLIWTMLLSEEEQEQLGNALAQCATPRLAPVRLWMELRGFTQPRAIIELAHGLNLLSPAEYSWLLRGIRESRPQVDGSPPPVDGDVKPRWDAARRELRYRGRVVRRVRSARVAHTISAILDAFEEADWPPRIEHAVDVSLSPQPVHDAVQSLNRRLHELRFRVDGVYICWTES
ncbi:MAG: hypothetical protein KY475_06810 [Planctomycetes bacterium]|nr:hypothetical protein [Planctomycetota bacterium]